MKDYRVSWTIEVCATGPEHAAVLAAEIMLDPQGRPQTMTVEGEGEPLYVDVQDGAPMGFARPATLEG